MKRFLKLMLVFCSILVLTNVAFAAEKSIQNKPVAVILNPDYEFPSVLDGTEVAHEFVIKNKGNALLIVKKVKTTWGCTAASYTKQIPSGEEGKILIKVKTEGSGGKLLKKKITVLTNDEINPKINLTIAGNVTKFVTIIPKRVNFMGFEGQDLRTTVKIIPEENYPFKILDILTIEKSNISYKLKGKSTSDRKEYVIEIQNLKTDKGFYNEVIELVTDSKIKPKIKLHITGIIREKP